MTKLGKAAAAAVAVGCLAGGFFLANPSEPLVMEQQVYEMPLSHAQQILDLAVMEKEADNGEAVSLNSNREVAGVAAVLSGNLDLSQVQANTGAVAGYAKIAESSNASSETAASADQKTETQNEKAAQKIILTAKVENSLNIRKKPDENSDVVGKLFRGCSAEVTKEKGDWYQIKSGKVTGWVHKKYVLTGEKAEAYLKKADPSVATVTAKTLNLRKAASTDSDVVSVLKKGTKFMVLSQNKKWVKIRYTTNLEGYVSADYVKVKAGAGEAADMKTLESYVKLAEKKEAERQAAQAAKEAAAQAAAESKKSTSSGKSSAKSGSSTSRRSSYSASVDDTTLLAALCEYEAGTNYDNCLAVANVVLNRVRSSSYPNSIRGVIYQSGQFGTVTSGALNRFLSRGPSSTCVRAAKAALSGSNNIGGRLQFRAVWATSPSAHKNSVVIGDNCFF